MRDRSGAVTGHARGQAMVEAALIIAVAGVVLAAAMLRFADTAAGLDQLWRVWNALPFP